MRYAESFARVIAVVALALGSTVARAQAACLVVDPELQGSYGGGCVDGKAEGKGTAKGTAAYTGEFHEGKKHGRGVKTWARGDRYEGEFADDTMNGWGVYTWGARSLFAGDRYEGQMTKDKRNGYGVYTWASGDSYAGPWKDDAVAGRSTPMMIARFRATSAAMEALAKPGVKVCHESGIAAPPEARTEGETQELNKAAQQVSIKVTRVGAIPPLVAGAAVAAGEVVWDDPLHWIPCR